MRQRVVIAMAVACSPRVLIADEPTTALDVTIQAGVLDVFRDLRDRLGTAIVLITHDLGVVADIADRAVVMYAGRAVEQAPVRELFARPRHPYTVGLMGALPSAAMAGPDGRRRLDEIPGMVPLPYLDPDACAFRPRCPGAQADCAASRPALLPHGNDHRAACFHPAQPGSSRTTSGGAVPPGAGAAAGATRAPDAAGARVAGDAGETLDAEDTGIAEVAGDAGETEDAEGVAS
jgi:peptide/nickel transport system ATP-binding protein